MEYQLVVIRGRSASTAVKLQDGVTNAGRGEDCQLRIKSSQVSRKHCELFEKHGMLLVKDLGSSNGTYVNAKKVEGQRVMEPGDELKIGPIVFRVEKIGQPAPAKVAPAAPVAAGKGPSDTAITEAVGGDDDFEIDFDDEPGAAAGEAVALDDEIALEEDPATKVELPTVPKPTAPAKGPSPGLAASTKPAPPKKPEPAPPKEEAVADDAVADFLMGLKMEDE